MLPLRSCAEVPQRYTQQRSALALLFLNMFVYVSLLVFVLGSSNTGTVSVPCIGSQSGLYRQSTTLRCQSGGGYATEVGIYNVLFLQRLMNLLSETAVTRLM